jgi:hypothetical protein
MLLGLGPDDIIQDGFFVVDIKTVPNVANICGKVQGGKLVVRHTCSPIIKGQKSKKRHKKAIKCIKKTYNERKWYSAGFVHCTAGTCKLDLIGPYGFYRVKPGCRECWHQPSDNANSNRHTQTNGNITVSQDKFHFYHRGCD